MFSGRELYARFRDDAGSGFAQQDESQMTLDQVMGINQIKRVIEELEGRLDRIKASWMERDRILNQSIQWGDIEETMKMVRDHIIIANIFTYIQTIC